MMTEEEKAKVDLIRDSLTATAHEMITSLGAEPTPEAVALFVGTNMATIDGLFAIRDKEAWRGLTDPSEISAALLQIALHTRLQ